MTLRFLTLLLLLATQAFSSQIPTVVLDKSETTNLSSHLEFLRDPGSRLTLAEAQKSKAWKPITDPQELNPKWDRATYWTRIHLTSQEAAEWVLTLKSKRWQELDWYLILPDGTTSHTVAGLARRGPVGHLDSLSPNITHNFRPGETITLYLRQKSIARATLHLYAIPLVEANPIADLPLYYISMGGLGTLCVLGLFFAWHTRQIAGLYLSTSTFLTGSVFVLLAGIGELWDIPGNAYLSVQGINLSSELAMLLVLLFYREAFEIKVPRHWTTRLWYALLAFNLFGFLFIFVAPYSLCTYFLNFHTLILGLGSYAMGIWAWRRGQKSARFFLLSWPIFWGALMHDGFARDSLEPMASAQGNLVVFGDLIFQVSLFLVFADRVRLRMKQATALQERLFKKEKDLNDTLEETVTERTAALAEATDQAVRANQAKDLFLANMGHEIRTPISALIGLSQVLVRKGSSINLPPDFQRLVGQIRSGSSHLNLMLSNLMDVGVASQGKVPLTIAEISLPQWSETLEDILQPLAEARQVTLHWHTHFPGSTTLRTDQVRLSQILINLVHNALKFSPPQGEVQVDISLSGDTLTATVRDQGSGLPEDPSSLFELFTRNESELSDHEHGAGLGLHVVKTTLDLLGGTVTADNHPSGGAQFSITVPPYPHPK